MKKKILIVGSQGAISKNLLNYKIFEKEKILLLSQYKHKSIKTYTYKFPDVNFDESKDNPINGNERIEVHQRVKHFKK